MRRLVLLVAIAVVAAGTTGCSSIRAVAFRVDNTEVSQSTLDDELSLLHDNPVIAASIVRSQHVPQFLNGSITAAVTTRWVNFRVRTALARIELARLHGHVTAADRGVVNLPTTGAYAQLSKSFRRFLIDTLALPTAAARVLAARDPAVKSRAPSACPSSRYVSHILVKTLVEATAIKGLLDGGRDFAKLARANSIDTGSAAQGGRLGCLDDLKSLVAPFATAAASQPIGVVSDPVQTQYGFSLILVTSQPTQADLEVVAFAVLEGKLRRTDVSIDPRYGRWDRTNGQVLPPSAPSG